MRAFFAAWLLSWAIGIAAGVFKLPLLTAFALAVAAFLLVPRLGLVWPAGAAAGSLILLGWVWGAAQYDNNLACAARDEAQVVVTAVQKVTEQSAGYLVKSSDGCLMLLTAGRWPRYEEGQYLKVKGKIEPVESLVRFAPEYRLYLKDHGVQLVSGFPEVEATGGKVTWLAVSRRAVRRQAEQVLAEPSASLVMALLMGERGSLPPELENNFRLTGVTHLLSISGWHMSLIVGLIFLLLQMA